MDATNEIKEISEEERKYIQKEFKNKNYQVVLNRYTEWIIIQSFDKLQKTNATKEQLRKGGASICQHIQKTKTQKIQVIDYSIDPAFTKALIEGILLGNYQYIKYLKNPSEKQSNLGVIAIYSANISQIDWNKLANIIQAVYHTRNLVNEQPSVLTSEALSEAIKKLGNEAGFMVEIFDESKIKTLKMNGLLAVNKGSILPPTFSVLTWKPKQAKNSKPIVLIGKGVVYDTGGYSLKPTPDSMDYMKCDMAGAATVASVMYAIAKNNLPVYCIALVPSTDNHIGANAYTPGDIITYSDGTSVEVMNTDAEGRIILADALLFAKQLNPEMAITVATLTGSAQKAIGSQALVGMGNLSDEIVQQLVQSGEDAYERIAVFPFWDEYKESLKSEIADLKNLGGDSAGAITAGKFLEHFTNYPFYHFDIAGVAYLKKQENYRTFGGTGFGVRLLYHFIENFIKLH
jgi:leucyl aminopeptidase